MPDLGSTQMTMLWASIALGLVYLIAAVLPSVGQRGMPWALGPRDDPPPTINAIGSRLDRAWRNFLETFPIFAALIFLEAHSGHQSGLAPLGAQLYFWGRVAFLPIYALGIPVARTLAWTVALVGIILLLLACLPGM
ncbi:MAG: MAPEG family protein [Hyphomonadaceae bacterium]